MKVLDAEFVQGFIRMADDGWQQGWHELIDIRPVQRGLCSLYRKGWKGGRGAGWRCIGFKIVVKGGKLTGRGAQSNVPRSRGAGVRGRLGMACYFLGKPRGGGRRTSSS